MLRHEVITLKQSEETIRQTLQSRSNEHSHCEQDRRQLQTMLDLKNGEASQLGERCRQLDLTARQLQEQVNVLSIRLNERRCHCWIIRRQARPKAMRLRDYQSNSSCF